MTTRRRFLTTGAGALAMGAVLGPIAACSTSRRAETPSATGQGGGVPQALGVQLWMVRDELDRDFDGALAALRDAGYRQVEVKLLHGRTAPAFRAALDRLGLVAPGLHADLLPLRAGLDSLLGDAQALGAEYVALAWYGEAERPASRDGWLRLADEVNGFGRQAQARGLQFAYHNHAFEFADAGGEPAYDVLLGALDPDLVTMQIDHYWVTKAGYDPADYLTRYPGRFPLWHLKDAAGAEQRIAAVGSGAVDWPRLFALAGVAGLRYAFVDAEDTGRDLDTARESLAYLDTLR